MLRPLPPPHGRGEVLDLIGWRAEKVRTLVDARASLVIETGFPAGKKQKLSMGADLAYDRQLPGLWLRVEKFGQKVLGLRARQQSFWIEIPDTKEVVTGGPEAWRKLEHLLRPDEIEVFFASPQWLGLHWPATEMKVAGKHYRFDVHLSGFLVREVFVARRKVVVEKIVEYDVLGRAHTIYTMAKYRAVDGVETPFRLGVERTLSGVKIRVRLGRPKLNKDVSPSFFSPKRRPGWRHINLDLRPVADVEAFRGGR